MIFIEYSCIWNCRTVPLRQTHISFTADDILVYFNGTARYKKALQYFKNSLRSTIKFTYEIEQNNAVSFLKFKISTLNNRQDLTFFMNLLIQVQQFTTLLYPRSNKKNIFFGIIQHYSSAKSHSIAASL